MISGSFAENDLQRHHVGLRHPIVLSVHIRCSALQCVPVFAACCSLLQCVTVCYSELLQMQSACLSISLFLVCSSMLQRVAVCCSALHVLQ